MSVGYNPSIVTSGLILCLDPKNPRSYSGSGATMYDASSFVYSGATSTNTLTGSPTYNSAGYLTFNGAGTQNLRVTRGDLNGGSWAYTNVTCCAWVRISSSAAAGDNNIATVESAWEYRYNNQGNGTSVLYYASNPWAWYGPSTAVSNNTWMMLTFRHGASNGDLWSNNTQIFTQAISGGIGAGTGSYPYLTIMARTDGTGSPAMGDLGQVFIYSRALTDAEITQNFNAARGRYGV